MNKTVYLQANTNPYGDNCFSCGGVNNPFMLKTSLWEELVPESKHMKSKFYRNKSGEVVREGGCFLCLKCVELRLDRPLVEDDFHELKPPINYGIFGFDCRVFTKLKGW